MLHFSGFDYDMNNSFRGGDIEKKLYLLFSERNRKGNNVHHLELEFEKDLLMLVPNIFQFVVKNSSRSAKQYEGKIVGSKYYSSENTMVVCPLSIMYEVIRKLPSQDGLTMMEHGCVIQ